MPGKPLSTETKKALGEVVRRLRKARGLSQEQLGLDADIQRKFISKIETGVSEPSVTTLFALGEALNETPSSILAAVEQEVRKTPKPQNARRKRSAAR